MAHLFETEQWIRAPLETVFRFFSDPRNLAKISPPSAGARLKAVRLVPPNADRAEELAGAGSEIEISIRLLPYLPLRGLWTARIVEFEWLNFFRDEQVRGPFKCFVHRHSFVAEVRNGQQGTVIRDHVEYEIGFGPLGTVADVMIVRRVLNQMFAYRHAVTEKLLGR
jgi:ligand-binding SRPBCC domain-containing protein